MLRRLQDQLIYNETYAPNYPAEDQTSLEHEERRLIDWLSEVAKASRVDIVKSNVALAKSAVEEACALIRSGRVDEGQKAFGSAKGYVQGALSRKQAKVAFIAGPAGIQKL